jgi:SAM-dependent methyltransferase
MYTPIKEHFTMEGIRKFHNNVKRALIQSVTSRGSYVLDVGCGFGGDIQKWFKCGAILFACDPNKEALKEAKKRALDMKIPVDFFEGDVLSTPERPFDIICYNFSLHYIFQSRDLFFRSIHAIRKRLRKGCKLVGIIPDTESLLMSMPFCDELGNTFEKAGPMTGYGAFGEKIVVELVDTPFYKGGAKMEPLAYKDMLVTHLEELGVSLESWSPLVGHSKLSGLYSVFIFVCN